MLSTASPGTKWRPCAYRDPEGEGRNGVDKVGVYERRDGLRKNHRERADVRSEQRVHVHGRRAVPAHCMAAFSALLVPSFTSLVPLRTLFIFKLVN